jgi:predicted nucleotidyltransferase
VGIARKRTNTRAREGAKASLADALFGQTKQRVLGLLFGQPDRAFGTVELIDLARSGRGAVQRELELLARVGLVETEVVGLQKRYHANQQSPVFEELRRIVEKTSGVAGVLRAALAPLGDKLDLAVLYGSVAKKEDTSQSDIDVLLVSEVLTLEDTYRALEQAEVQLGRPINPTIYSPADFRARRQSKQPFLAKVLSGPHAVLIGTLDGDRAAR